MGKGLHNIWVNLPNIRVNLHNHYTKCVIIGKFTLMLGKFTHILCKPLPIPCIYTIVVSLSPVKEPKSLIKFWFCSGSLRPRPVSITWRAELFEKRRTRRKICFTSIAKSIDGANASKQKISELVWLWNYQWQPTLKNNPSIHPSTFCHALSYPLRIQRSNSQQQTPLEISNFFRKLFCTCILSDLKKGI